MLKGFYEDGPFRKSTNHLWHNVFETSKFVQSFKLNFISHWSEKTDKNENHLNLREFLRIFCLDDFGLVPSVYDFCSVKSDV